MLNCRNYDCLSRGQIADEEKLGEYFVREFEYLNVLDKIYNELSSISNEFSNRSISEIPIGDVERIMETVRDRIDSLKDEVG